MPSTEKEKKEGERGQQKEARWAQGGGAEEETGKRDGGREGGEGAAGYVSTHSGATLDTESFLS